MKSFNYVVYVHISPLNKLYIGITRRSIEERWNKGKGYKKNKHFWGAIQKYGWDNFKHIVLIEGLSHDVACECEKYLIAKYRTTDCKYGYNITIGGDGRVGAKQSEEARLKIAQASKEHWKNEEFRQKIISKNKGKKMSPDAIRCIKEKQLGKYVSQETRKKISKANKGKTAWNKGLVGVCHHTEQTKQKIGDAFRGKHLSDGHIQKMVQTRRKNGSYQHSDVTKEKLRQVALNMTDEQKKKIAESVKRRWEEGAYKNTNYSHKPAWNKGLTKDDPRVAKHVREKGTFHHSDESKLKMSKSHKGKKAHNRKKVVCVETGIIYDSMADATKQTGVSNISNAVKFNIMAGGFHWRLADEQNNI